MAEGGQNLFLELVNDIVYMVSLKDSTDPATARVEYINRKVKDITGHDPEDFVKDPSLWTQLVHPKDFNFVLRATYNLIRKRENILREYRIRTKEGSYIWVEDRLIPVIEKDKVIGFIGIARDVTKRKVLEYLSVLALGRDIQKLFDRAVSCIKDALNADLVAIYEVPEGEKEGILRAGEGISRKLINRYKLPLKEGTEFYYSFFSKKPVVITDVDKEKRFSFSLDTHLLGLKSGICLPIKDDEKPYGTLCIYSREKRKFSKEELNFTTSVANIIGLALRRHRFEKELENSEKKLQKANRLYKTLSVISEIVLQERDVDELLKKVCTACVLYGGFKASWVGLFRNNHLEIISSCGDVDDFLRDVEEPILERIEEGIGPCGIAYTRGEMVVNNDTASFVQPDFLRDEMLRRGFLSSVSVPLKLGGKVAGIFNLYAGEKNFFDEDTEKLIREIGDQIVFSLEFLEKEEELRRLSLAVEQTTDWVLITDENGIVQYANKAVEEITGYKVEELIGKKPNIFKSGKHSYRFYRRLWETILSGRTFRSLFINRRKDDKLFYIDQTITPLRNKEGKIIGFVATGKDITQERELQEKLRYFAYYDPVTELPNRTNFMERLRLSIARTKVLPRNLAVLLIDIDRFKYINDTYGYPTGDSVLKSVADRIRGAVREGDTVARLGSDEFGVILIDLAKKEDIPKVLSKILSEVEKPMHIGGEEIRLTLSIGVSICPDDGIEAEDLIKKAEIALVHAKEDRSNSYQFFKEEMNTQITEIVLMEKHLMKALDRKEYVLHFQPYFDLKNLKPQGMEALLRWNSEDLGFVPPVKFIPVLEDTGLIREVGEWILRKSCEVAERWGKFVSVNVSPVQFKDRDFPDKVERIIEETGISGGCLTLEITETTIMEDVDFTKRSLKKLKELGVKVAIDDFGTGYSSLAYLKLLPVDFLKIDVSFVIDIDRDPEDRAIVNAIIQLAKNLGLITIAEGIETEKQLNILRDMGCDMGQGYYLARPMPEEELKEFLEI